MALQYFSNFRNIYFGKAVIYFELFKSYTFTKSNFCGPNAHPLVHRYSAQPNDHLQVCGPAHSLEDSAWT